MTKVIATLVLSAWFGAYYLFEAVWEFATSINHIKGLMVYNSLHDGTSISIMSDLSIAIFV